MIKTIGTMGVGLMLAALLGAGPATQRATRPDSAFAQDASDLGSADFAARQSATRRLWWDGDAALPALQKAAAGDNPEAAERARALLQNIDDGIAPSTPPGIVAILHQYRTIGDLNFRRNMISALRGGIDGARVLIHLEQHETNPELRQRIGQSLAQSPRLPAALLLSEGKRDEAEALLEKSCGIGVIPAHDFVAYWEMQPASDRRAAAFRLASDRKTWWASAMFEQADGDHEAAMRDAGTIRDLSYWLAAGAGDWPGLLKALLANRSTGKLKDAEVRAVAALLSGDSSPAGLAQIKLISTAPADPGPVPDMSQRADALCLADRPADAEALLIANGDFAGAWDLLAPQLQYSQQLSLLGRAKGNPMETARLQARAALLLTQLGKRTEANYMLDQAIGGNRMFRDADTAARCISASRRLRPVDKTDELLADILNGPQQPTAVFENAGFSDPAAAETWWMFLGHGRPGTTPIAAIHLLRAIDGGHVPPGDLTNLIAEFANWSLPQAPPVQQGAMLAEAWAWKVAGQPDRQFAILQRCAVAFGSVETSMLLGEAAEDRQDWAAAADAYAQAARYDPANATAAFLHGYALTKLGDAQQGRALMDLGHDLPLGNESQRTDFFNAAIKRGLLADANRERDILLATANFNLSLVIPFLERMTVDSLKHKDYASAARSMGQTIWAMADSNAIFTDVEAYVRIPAQLHRIRAMALFAAHKPDDAMKEAALFNQHNPGDSTGQMFLVRAAEDAGATAQADELFNTSIARFSALLHDYPDSPQLHNQIAWEESRCRRNLDDALAHAQRAAQLDPDNAAILDTLAETQYQRKEFQAAIDTINRCIALDPRDTHFDKQLARFQLGLQTGKVDDQ